MGTLKLFRNRLSTREPRAADSRYVSEQLEQFCQTTGSNPGNHPRQTQAHHCESCKPNHNVAFQNERSGADVTSLLTNASTKWRQSRAEPPVADLTIGGINHNQISRQNLQSPRRSAQKNARPERKLTPITFVSLTGPVPAPCAYRWCRIRPSIRKPGLPGHHTTGTFHYAATRRPSFVSSAASESQSDIARTSSASAV